MREQNVARMSPQTPGLCVARTPRVGLVMLDAGQKGDMGQATFLIVLVALVGIAWFGLSRYKSRSSSYQRGFRPKSVTPWGQFVRLWQADHGRGDN
jgi:hypothetical protein